MIPGPPCVGVDGDRRPKLDVVLPIRCPRHPVFPRLYDLARSPTRDDEASLLCKLICRLVDVLTGDEFQQYVVGRASDVVWLYAFTRRPHGWDLDRGA